jgi:transposase
MQNKDNIAFTKENFKLLLNEKSAMELRIAALEKQLQEQKTSYEQALQDLQEKYQLTKEQIAWLRRQMYGRKTERFIPSDPGQLELAFEQVIEKAPEELGFKEITYKKKKGGKKPGEGRNLLPAHLKRVEEIIQVKNLAEGAIKIGEEVSEILEIQEPNIFVRRIVRPKYVQPKQDGVQIAPMPALPIPKGMAGASVIAHILTNKYVYHLPLNRTSKMFARFGLNIADSTMCDWVRQGLDLLIPLYDLLKELILSSGYVQADETTIKVLDENKKGAHLGYYWAYCSPEHRMAYFEYRKGRGREGPEEFFKGYTGAIQSDAYAGYNMFDKRLTTTLLGCMAHIRRKFDEAKNNDYPRASVALGFIKELYMVERKAREANMDEAARKALRDKEATPILRRFYKWLLENAPVDGNKVKPKSDIGQAIKYALKNSRRIKRIYESGRYEIDNNLVENNIRPIAVGRKNYLFAGSHDAAQRAAVAYSLIAICKLNDVNPVDWLNDVIARIPAMTVNQMEPLLPMNWKPID